MQNDVYFLKGMLISRITAQLPSYDKLRIKPISVISISHLLGTVDLLENPMCRLLIVQSIVQSSLLPRGGYDYCDHCMLQACDFSGLEHDNDMCS